jgi:hypothetical protein
VKNCKYLDSLDELVHSANLLSNIVMATYLLTYCNDGGLTKLTPMCICSICQVYVRT